MKKIALGLASVFIVALAVAVAKQLSSEAVAVIVGIACGIGASIPTALVLIAVMRVAEERADKERERTDAAEARYRDIVQRPQVVIVAPPALWRPEDWRHPRHLIAAQDYGGDAFGHSGGVVDIGQVTYTAPDGAQTYHDGTGWRRMMP